MNALKILADVSSSSEEAVVSSETREILQPLEDFRRRCLEEGSNSRWKNINFPNGKIFRSIFFLKYNSIVDFPSEAVVKGYLLPKVDASLTEFRWNPPDMAPLVKYPFSC